MWPKVRLQLLHTRTLSPVAAMWEASKAKQPFILLTVWPAHRETSETLGELTSLTDAVL